MNVDTLEAQLVAAATAKGVPVSGSLELLPLCNFNCRMCYIRLSKSEQEEIRPLLTTGEWIRIADQLQEAGTLFLTITGGEPLLYPGFRELYLHLQRLGMFLTLNTNGSLIDEEWVSFFRENPPRRINITLYGSSNETYEKLCRAPGALPKVLEAIRMLKEAGIAVKLNISLSAGNCTDYEGMLQLAEEMECPATVDTYMQPARRERKRAYELSSRMSPEQAASYDIRTMQNEKGEKEFTNYAAKLLQEVDARKKELEGTTGKKEEGFRCRAGHTSFVVNWQGMVCPCAMLQQPQMSALSQNFSACWENLRDGCRKTCLNEKCSACPYLKVCQICPAAERNEEISAEGKPEYLCRYTEAYIRMLQKAVNSEKLLSRETAAEQGKHY